MRTLCRSAWHFSKKSRFSCAWRAVARVRSKARLGSYMPCSGPQLRPSLPLLRHHVAHGLRVGGRAAGPGRRPGRGLQAPGGGQAVAADRHPAAHLLQPVQQHGADAGRGRRRRRGPDRLGRHPGRHPAPVRLPHVLPVRHLRRLLRPRLPRPHGLRRVRLLAARVRQRRLRQELRRSHKRAPLLVRRLPPARRPGRRRLPHQQQRRRQRLPEEVPGVRRPHPQDAEQRVRQVQPPRPGQGRRRGRQDQREQRARRDPGRVTPRNAPRARQAGVNPVRAGRCSSAGLEGPVRNPSIQY